MAQRDLSFDELDKAVASAMAGKQTEPQPSGQEPHTAAEQPSRPKAAALAVAPRRSIRLAPQSQSPKAVVDIMAPSPARKTPSRYGSTLQPVNPQPAAASGARKDQEPIKQVATAPPPKPITPEAPPQPEAAEPPMHDERWPDPLDFHGDLHDTKEPASPFIPGAKVEKRPLGAFADTEESDDSSAVAEEKPPNSPQPAEETAATEPPKTQEPALTATPEEPAPPTAQEQLRESATLSIPQQYKTTTKTAADTVHPLFDTKEYHPPLLETTNHAHHGKLWLIVLLVIASLVLIAVAGYAVYLYLNQGAATTTGYY